MREELSKMWKVLARHDRRLRKMSLLKLFRAFFDRKLKQNRQEDMYRGIHLALVVDTRDPWKQNRVRFFSPVLYIPKNEGDNSFGYGDLTTKVNQCDWAWPVSPMGGFDDCGMTWVPPPGSTVCIVFQNNNPKMPFYIGTTWQRFKGPENQEVWNFDIPEYNKLFRGHRKGYMVGANDESQHLPPFNTHNYQGFDFDSRFDLEFVPDASEKTTWPHVYGWKTPEKHMMVMDDGDPKCNRRWKRLEIMSSLGHYFLMKDDPYHRCGDWVNPKCKDQFYKISQVVCLGNYQPDPFPNTGGISVIPSIISVISTTSGPDIGVLYTCPQGPDFCPRTSTEGVDTPVEVEYLGTEYLCPGFTAPSTLSTIPLDCLGVLGGLKDICFSFNNEGRNKYHKQKQECFPFLCDKCALVQSGMQLLSRSGATLVFDDSVEEPRERPEWERALKEFDMDGCTGCFKGRTFLRSATGHYILLDDSEDQPRIRGRKNGMTLGTACGNMICMSDHTLPDGIAGEYRGMHFRSTANHTLDFCDDTNLQASVERNGCSKTGPWAKKAFVRLRSGYGITLLMSDGTDQQKTTNQYCQILSPQKDNLQRGPHIFHMQERPSGPGQIFIRAGGDYIVHSYDDMVEVVGDEKDNPSNKLEFVSKQKVVSVKDVYYNKAKTHVFWADDFVFLLAGKDCPQRVTDPETGALLRIDEGTCVYPVVVATTSIPEYVTAMTGLKASEHVFASALRGPCDQCEGIASD